MSWNPRMLRLVSALGLALTLFAALPHLHADEAAHAPNAPIAGLTSDDAHESHRATLDADAHPCALCRGRQDLEHAATPTAPLQLARSEDPRPAVARNRFGPGWRPVRRAPARAPPLA